jgi:hypothetical protein
MSDHDEIAPDVDGWARAHGFTPSGQQVGGATPFLRLGMMDVTDDAYQGTVGGREALLSELSIESPDASEAFGGSGGVASQFTLLLVAADAGAWPRLTLHPAHFGDHDWVGRLLRQDRAVSGLGERFDQHYRVIASTEIPDRQLHELFDQRFQDWCLQQDDLVMDVEAHPGHGGYLMVATAGFGIGDQRLDTLLEQTEHVLEQFAATSHPL